MQEFGWVGFTSNGRNNNEAIKYNKFSYFCWVSSMWSPSRVWGCVLWKQTLKKGLGLRQSIWEERQGRVKRQWVCPCAELLRQLNSIPPWSLWGTYEHASEMHRLRWQAETCIHRWGTHTYGEVPSRVLTSHPPTHTCANTHTLDCTCAWLSGLLHIREHWAETLQYLQWCME